MLAQTEDATISFFFGIELSLDFLNVEDAVRKLTKVFFMWNKGFPFLKVLWSLY